MKTSILIFFLGVAALAAGAADANLSELPESAKVSRCVLNSKDRTNDDTITLTSVPDLISNLQMVSISHTRAGVPAPGYSITIDCNAVVYILVNDIGNPTIPASWKKLDIKTEWQINSVKATDSIYAQYFTPGKVDIPGHDGKGDRYYGIPNVALIKPDK